MTTKQDYCTRLKNLYIYLIKKPLERKNPGGTTRGLSKTTVQRATSQRQSYTCSRTWSSLRCLSTRKLTQSKLCILGHGVRVHPCLFVFIWIVCYQLSCC